MYVRRIVAEPIPDGVKIFLEPIKVPTRVERISDAYVVDVYGFVAVGTDLDTWFYLIAPEVKIARALRIATWSKKGFETCIRYLVATPSLPPEIRSGLYVVDMSRKVLYMYGFNSDSLTIVEMYGKLLQLYK